MEGICRTAVCPIGAFLYSPGETSLWNAHKVAEHVHDEVEHVFPDVKHIMIHLNPADEAGWLSQRLCRTIGTQKPICPKREGRIVLRISQRYGILAFHKGVVSTLVW